MAQTDTGKKKKSRGTPQKGGVAQANRCANSPCQATIAGSPMRPSPRPLHFHPSRTSLAPQPRSLERYRTSPALDRQREAPPVAARNRSMSTVPPATQSRARDNTTASQLYGTKSTRVARYTHPASQ